MKTIASPIKRLALELGIATFQPARIRDQEAQQRIRELETDAMIVVAYGQILPLSLLNAPRLGTLNVHASLLPRHRGAAPIEWAILSGDTESGVTIMQMDAGVDTGPMLSQERVRIAADETAETLTAKLAPAGARLLVDTLARLQKGEVMPTPQPVEGVTQARRLRSEDGKLDPVTMSAPEIDRRVRALGERIGCWIALMGAELKVLSGHLDGGRADGIPVQARDGAVYFVDEVQPPGGRRMSAAAWARGRR